MGKDKEVTGEVSGEMEREEPVTGEETAKSTESVAGEDLAAELAKAREEAKEAQDKLLRLAAEFDNQKKRLHREKETALKFAEENLIKEILPSIDNLERAMSQDQNNEDFGRKLLEGVELTRKGLLDSLSKIGLKPIESVGEPFNPNFHEALAMEPSKDVPEQRVKDEFEKGYMFKDRLIRAAKVIVSKGDVE